VKLPTKEKHEKEPPKTPTKCDPSKVNLLDYEVWRREQGYWVGKYSFYGSDGYPFSSQSWPYPYQPYKGVIHIEITGNHLKQRNIFIYPPASKADCLKSNNSVIGKGKCGINGNEKIFSADQYSSDCLGNLAGPYKYGAFTLDTYTTIMGDDTVIYQVRYRKTDIPQNNIHIPAGAFNQNQITSLTPNGIRVRTDQAFNIDQTSQAASYYRENRVAKRSDFISALYKIRKEYNILPSDYCGWDQLGLPSGVSCTKHFGFIV
jgi:hypothetical protein